MLQHIVLMNLIAPAIAYCLRDMLPKELWRSWPYATAVQIALIWGWHAPSVLESAFTSMFLMGLMHASLFAAALWFWGTLASMAGNARWRALFALLVTGKLFCLLGALLVFAPRSLFDGFYDLCGPAWQGAARAEDQHFAGLMMLIACPLSYVAAGVLISERWFRELEMLDRRDDRSII
ncbi:cytochrome c oxidase assembly protein [Agaricicola taiwanensis]|nr:cytochrome c oxidase assembly protein [Agaricicola taiwanensis]